MSGDGRIDVSPDGKRLLLSIDMGEESGRKDWEGPLPALWAFDLQSQKATEANAKKPFRLGRRLDRLTTMFSFSAARWRKGRLYLSNVGDGKNLKRLIKNGAFPVRQRALSLRQ
jgi:TolB protein